MNSPSQHSWSSHSAAGSLTPPRNFSSPCNSDAENHWQQQDIYIPSESKSAARRRRRQRQQHNTCQGSEPFFQATAPSEEASSFAPEYCARLQVQLESGNAEDVSAALADIKGNVWALARDKNGTVLLQKALADSTKTVEALASELYGHATEAARCKHANYFLQEVIVRGNLTINSVIAEKLQPEGARLARHEKGCRSICRLLEHAASEESTKTLVRKLLLEDPAGANLCQHVYGHVVVQSILEHGADEHKCFIAQALQQDLLGNAQNRFASFVVQDALSYCSREYQDYFVRVLADVNMIAELANSRFGVYVACSLLQRPGMDAHALALSQMIPAIADLKANGFQLQRRERNSEGASHSGRAD